MKKKSSKKSAKKAAKKSARKPAKKAAKKSVKKKASKKPKKVAKKAVKKKSSAKAAPRKKKAAPKRKSSAKKTLKPKAAKKKSAKKTTAKSVKRVAKKVTIKKAAVKKVKKVSRPSAPKAVVTTPVASPAVSTPFQQHRSSLKAGDIAPYFEGMDQHGNSVRLSDFSGKKVVLYFYPKDFTDGCTAEACNLRDEYQYLGQANFEVVGVSADDQDSHARFAQEHNLPFTLLADTNKTIINAYDVWGPKMTMGNRYDGIVRTTFIIGTDRRIENVIHDVNTKEHAQQILAL